MVRSLEVCCALAATGQPAASAEQHDELARFHCSISRASDRQVTSLSYGGDRCAAGFRSSLCRRWVNRVDRASDESPLISVFQTCQAAVSFVAMCQKPKSVSE
jgi:hypothetical protein